MMQAWLDLPPAVRRLLAGEAIGLLAAGTLQVALAWWIGREGGAAALALYGALTGAAALLAVPLLSPAGDRWPKGRLLRLGRLCLVLDAALVSSLAAFGSFHLGALCACGLVPVLAWALLGPVEASVLPEMVAAGRLPGALRLRRAAQAAGGLLGPALGGLVLAGAGVAAALALALLLFALAALAAWRTALPAAAAAAAPRGWFGDVGAGLRAKWQVRLDRWWTLVGAAMMLCLLPATGLLLPLRIQAAGLSPAWFGACSAALSAGLLLGVAGPGPALIGRLGRVRALALVIAACAAALAGIGLADRAPLLVALFVLVGLCLSVTQLVGQTHRMLAMPEAFRARMSAAHLMVAHAAGALAPALAGALLQQVPVATAYLVLAAGFGAGGLLLLAVPGLGPFLRQDHEGARDWYARHYPHAFRARE